MSKDRINLMKEMLMDALLRDLSNEDKCTPGLYTVVRGILSDNKDALDSIPRDVLNAMEEELRSSLPFKDKPPFLNADIKQLDVFFENHND